MSEFNPFPYHTRAEHDFFKMLEKLLEHLPNSKLKKEILSLIDGYLLETTKKVRKEDTEAS